VAKATATGGSGKAVRTQDGQIVCPCGDLLADRIEGSTVVIDGTEFQFRRRNDQITCRSCQTSHPVREFRTSSAPTDTGQRRRQDD
jgi:hypothetical protein